MVTLLKANRRNISIMRIITIVFILAMLVSTTGMGFLIFARWLSSAEQITESISRDISESINNQIYSFMRVPDQINEANQKIIENGILDLSDDKLRDKFFVGVLSSHDDQIYSFSYGTANGEYFGARRNKSGVIEIMRNNAGTGGNSWYYSVNEDLTAGELVVQAGKFDPRERLWYKVAEAAAAPTLSPVYKHFVMDDLTISAACPIYDANGKLQGVLGTHMLLSDIGTFLEDTVRRYDGYAVIIEKNTGSLIANSMGADNFTILYEGTLKRYRIGEIGNSDMWQAYEHYKTNQNPRFVYRGENDKLYVNTSEIHMEGFDWVVISAIPERLLMTNVLKSIYMTAFLIALALILSLIIYKLITGKLLRPINSLLQVSAALSSGDLSKRVEVVRNDEIGKISESLNKVADKMQYLINNLETSVKERTEELHKANVALVENKNQLQLLLNSTAEAILGIDVDGNFTFCNTSCIKMLGYNSPEELLGKNIHSQLHYNRSDGTQLNINECKILQSIMQGKGFEADDEVFWRADGTCFDVEYHSYPQISNGKIVGAVITFMDITDRKKREEEIQYLSFHDTLTGLHNRRFFEENMLKTDTEDNLPLSVIFADINGLKMTNDVFGHAAGDQLIKKSSEILVQSCRDNDLIARVGGDEFIIILPKTNDENTRNIISRIRSGLQDARIASIKCSISLGSDTKTSMQQSLEEIIANAENVMYRDKTANRKSTNKDIIDTIIDSLHSKSTGEKQHSIAVSELCGEIGAALHLVEPEINKLKRAGYLHDIGKITLDESVFSKEASLEEELEHMQQHPVVGYRILNLFDDTLDLAEYIYSHHEGWDGNGYPRGLKGEQIPLISRIISIAETYDRVLSKGEHSPAERKRAAIGAIKEGTGKQFDPQIAELFARMMDEKNR